MLLAKDSWFGFIRAFVTFGGARYFLFVLGIVIFWLDVLLLFIFHFHF